MKKAYIFFLVCSLLLLCGTKVFAENTSDATNTDTQTGDYTLETQVDDNTTTATNKYFDLTLTQDFQSPLDKSIVYTLTVVPHLDSTKVQMTWTSSSSSLTIKPRINDFVSMTNGQTYTYKATVKPTLSGKYTISVSVVAWQYDTNYTNSVEDSLTLDSGLVSIPVQTPYILILTAEILVIVGVIVFLILMIKKLLPVYTKKAKNWLTPPK